MRTILKGLGIAGLAVAGLGITCATLRRAEEVQQRPAGSAQGFAPKELWAAAGPPSLLGLFRASPARGVVKKTMGLDLAEQEPGRATLSVGLKLVHTVAMTVTVPDVDQACRALREAALQAGGYVSESQVERQDPKGTATFEVRVPVDRLDSTCAALSGLGQITSETRRVEDVTRAYTDLEGRMKVQAETRDRVRAILRERTAKLGDVLAAEKELARITTELEGMERERRAYDHRVALATLHVVLQPMAVQEARSVFTPLKEALAGLGNLLGSSMGLLLALLVVLLPWVALAGAVRWLWRRLRRKPVGALS